jgi:hypothetical protein
MVVDSNTALEIARFAYRAREFDRGNCWNFSAEEVGSIRANVIRGVGLQMGWNGKKGDAKVFQLYSPLLPKRSGAILDSWIMTHAEGMNVVRTLGTDDSDKMRGKARWDAFLNPPMKSGTHCTQAYVSAAGGGNVPGRCDSQTTVDNDALQRRLRQIDNQ